MSKAGTLTLTAEAIHEAILDRLGRNRERLGDRESNVGASRVGYCVRATVLDALCGEEVPELKGAGKMLSGKALENEVVQIIRGALGNRIRNTGVVQEDLKHPTAPLICHPDGEVLGPIYREVDDRLFTGNGALEIKTSSMMAFRKYVDKGLPVWYVDQNHVQMGLKGLGWGLQVLSNAECLGDVTWWIHEFDKARYQNMEERAHFIRHCIDSKEVPAGEPERGWCRSNRKLCQHSGTCKERIGVANLAERNDAATLSDSTRLGLEVLGEELADVQAQLDPLKAREQAIKEEARVLIEPTGLRKGDLTNATFELRGGGESMELDKKALEKAEPDLVKKYLKPVIKKPSFYFTPKNLNA